MARLAVVGCLALFGAACAVGSSPSPFGGATGDPEDDDEPETSSGTDTDPLATISDTMETTVPPTTSGVLPETDSSTTVATDTGVESTSEGSSSSGGGSSSGEASSSSTTGIGEYEMCATSNTLAACAVAGGNSDPYMDDVPCTTNEMFVNPEVYDFFVLDVASGDCVWVEADNAGGDADVMAYVVDLSGSYFGLEADYSELDDERACTTTPWNTFACPARGVTAAADGSLTIAIAQWGTTTQGCTDPSPYTAWVAVNGEDVDLSDALVMDDYVIDPLTCP